MMFLLQAQQVSKRFEIQLDLDTIVNSINFLAAVTLLIIGIVALIWGWRLYKIFVFIAGAFIGAYAGGIIAEFTQQTISTSLNYPLIMAIGLGTLFAFMAIPYVRFAMFALAGLAGGYALFIMGSAYHNGDYKEYFALSGFIVCGLVSLAFFEVIVVTATSFLGAGAIVTGILYFFKNTQLYLDLMTNYSWVIPVALAVFAIIGMLIQMKLLPEDGIKRPSKKPNY